MEANQTRRRNPYFLVGNPSYGYSDSHGETNFDAQGQGQLEILVAVDDNVRDILAH